jgi:hypothetical protein
LNDDSAATMLLTSAGLTLWRWQASRIIGLITSPGSGVIIGTGAGAGRLANGAGGKAASARAGAGCWSDGELCGTAGLSAGALTGAGEFTEGVDFATRETLEKTVQKRAKLKKITQKFMRVPLLRLLASGSEARVGMQQSQSEGESGRRRKPLACEGELQVQTTRPPNW